MAKIYIPDDRDLFFQHKTLARIHDPLERAKTNTSSVPSILGGGMFLGLIISPVQYATLLTVPFSKIPLLPKSLQLMRYGRRQL